jgi:2-dehydro-3-deoxyphosphogalactonate aldolase
MSPSDQLRAALAASPLIAILRGVHPNEVLEIGHAVLAGGWHLIEVPLNSPEPLLSIERLSKAFPDALIGAGTVLDAGQVREVHAAGGRMVVAPNFDEAVVRESVRLGMACLPGVMTASEAFSALRAGATGLKLFPAEMIPPGAVKALRAVLPPSTLLLPVGGITPGNMAIYRAAGADGFGIGSALYRPGAAAGEVKQKGLDFMAACAGTMRA